MQESFTKSSNYISKNKQDDIFNDLTNVRAEWDLVLVKIGVTLNNLKASLSRWNTLLDTKERLNNWLTEKEATLHSIPHGNGELSEMKTLLERLKYLDSEIAQKAPEVDEMVEEMKFFEPYGMPEEDFAKLQVNVQRYIDLTKRCAGRIQDFEIEIRDFIAYSHQMQEIEKWLLQISFQLMAHNSLYISNYEQTKEQITQHESLLDYIQKYQMNIDDLDAKGQQQIKLYEPHSSSIREKIETQIKNIQDSYNALLYTSIQIKNRLYDSLNKFKEYEDTLNSILLNLEVFGKVIEIEMEKPLETLNDVKSELQLMTGLQDKLQLEKHRLMIACQACEAATASISRPSSPVAPSPQIPEKELLVRAKLEDLIDKLLPFIDTLIDRVKDFDKILSKRDDINSWIELQTVFANDMAQKPSKLKRESGVQDIHAINDIIGQIDVKRNIILTEISNQIPDEELAEMDNKLDELQTLLITQIESRRRNQGIVDDYLESVNNSKTFFDEINQRLANIDDVSGQNCDQKLNAINEIKLEFTEKTPNLREAIQSNGEKVVEVISHLDAQQVDDHMKTFMRRENDVRKKIERKIQLMDMTNKNLSKLRADIEQAQFFFDDNINKFTSPQALGYKPKPIEIYLQHLRNISKDAENKQTFIESLGKRLSNIDAAEQQKMRQLISDMHKKEKRLAELIKIENSRATQGLSKAKALEGNLDIVRSWIGDQKMYNEGKALVISLAPSAIDYEIQEYKARLLNIKDFSEGTLTTTIDQMASIKDQCDAKENEEVDGILNDFSKEIQLLVSSYSSQLETLQRAMQLKTEYEQDSDGLMNWIKEVEAILSTNVKTSSIQILEEQMHKYEAILKDSESKAYVLTAIKEKADHLMKNLSEVDCLNLSCQVKNISDKFNLLVVKLRDHLNGIIDNIKQLRESQKHISEYTQFILSIQHAIKELNKPVGCKTQDVQNLLKEYENILNRLKTKKAEMSMHKVSTLPQIKELLSTHDDIIEAIENQLRRLKQLLMLREQFISLVNEIVAFNVKYTDIVAHVEKSDDKIENKIKQYDKIMMKIQECEGLLVTASDKGMQIASEGTVEDRNNIIEQLQTLKNQLNTLKQTVENLRQQHEKNSNLYKNFEVDIGKAINALHEKEAAIKILPILDINTESVEQELRKHDALVGEIKKLMIKLQANLEEVGNEQNLPSYVAESVSVARTLLKSLPKEMKERREYLDSNKDYRLNYIQLVGQFNHWVNTVESEFLNENDDIDFENISDVIKRHVESVDDKLPEVKILLERIDDSTKNILPSLNNINKEELLRDLQKFKASFKDIFARSEKSKSQLEENRSLWQNYCVLFKSVCELLKKVPKDDSIDSVEKLKKHLQKIGDKLQTIQVR